MRLVVGTVALAALALQLAACRRAEETSSTTISSVELDDPKAHHQDNEPDDLALVQEIRRRLVSDPSLSLRAKNLVVIVQDGVVTLRGPVADEVEHDLVIAKVASVPGLVRLDDRVQYERSRP